VLDKVLEMCCKTFCEPISDWADRLISFRDAGLRLLGFKPFGTPITGPKTVFGDVLEVYFLLGMQALGEIDLGLDLGGDALADGEPTMWLVERTFISGWAAWKRWAGVGMDHIAQPAQKGDTRFLTAYESKYAGTDPSSDVAVVLFCPETGERLMFAVQCKASSNPGGTRKLKKVDTCWTHVRGSRTLLGTTTEAGRNGKARTCLAGDQRSKVPVKA